MPSIDTVMFRQLTAASETGRGITVAQLEAVVTPHAHDGPDGHLAEYEKAALERAIGKDLFATYIGRDLAEDLVWGTSVTSVFGARKMAQQGIPSYSGTNDDPGYSSGSFDRRDYTDDVRDAPIGPGNGSGDYWEGGPGPGNNGSWGDSWSGWGGSSNGFNDWGSR